MDILTIGVIALIGVFLVVTAVGAFSSSKNDDCKGPSLLALLIFGLFVTALAIV